MDITTKSLFKSFIVNLILSIIKVVSGILGNSSALLADGIHSFSDLSTDAVAIFGNKYALKPADIKHPFGHGKVEYLTCLIIGIVILILGINIIFSAFKIEIIKPSRIIILVSIFTIIIKIMLYKYLLKIGYKYNNTILIASGKESSADVISSIFVLISSILMQFDNNILNYSNIVATIIVGLFILKTGIDILKENMSTILGESEISVDDMIEIINKNENIDTIDNFVVIKNGPYFQITGEVSMNPNLKLKEVHDVVDNIEQELKKLDSRAKYINIHVNPTKES